MKVYYYDSGWQQITAIVGYPNITLRNNMPGLCTVILRSFHDSGTQFSDWYNRDFTPMKVEDDDSEILFRGYLINKKFTVDSLILELIGFSILLEWTPFYKNYILAEGFVRISHASSTLTVWKDVDDDEIYDGGNEDFNWSVDHWITDKNVGLLIVDNTNDLSSETWECTTINKSAGAVYIEGDKNSLDSINGDSYYVTETSNDWDDYITITIGDGDVIPTALKIHSIIINYNIGIKNLNYGVKNWYLDIKKDGDWIEIFHIPTGLGTSDFHWESGELIIPDDSDAELKKYLTTDNGNYDYVTELRMRWTRTETNSGVAHIKIDYLTAEIIYYTDEIVPIMEAITDSAENTIICDGIDDWVKAGVRGYVEEGDDKTVGDIFKIGENTVTVVGNIATALSAESEGIGIEIIGQEVSSPNIVTLRPDGDDTTEWDNSGGGTHTQDVDEIVVQPNAGDGNYISAEGSSNLDDIFNMETVAMGGSNVATKIELWTYGKREGVAALVQCDIKVGDNWLGLKFPIPEYDNNYHWQKRTWENLSIDQTDLDNLQVKFYYITLGGGPNDKVTVNLFYLRITYGVYNPFTRFIARVYRGTHCIDVLKSVCKLEGADWMEDHINYKIKLVKPTTYEDSGVSLTDADYGHDFEFEDKCNQVRRVDVWGQAAYNIHEWDADPNVSGKISKQIIDESVTSGGDAKEIAKNELLKLKVKRPSIKLSLIGTYPNLQLGYYVDITMVRPSVSGEYPIRMIERKKFGKDKIQTIIYVGLGETADDERIGKTIKEIGYLANKGLADRLISTPWSAGANISHSDISGFDSRVESIINTEVGAGESIDNAIDTLLAAGFTLGSGNVINSANEDLTFLFGKALIDSRWPDMMLISHRASAGQDEYALGQDAAGNTYINARSGKLIHLHINDVMKMSMSAVGLTMGIPIAMGANKITGLGNPTNAQDAATRAWVLTLGTDLANYSAVANLDMNQYSIIDLPAPTSDNHAVRKIYVDNATTHGVASNDGIFTNVATQNTTSATYIKLKEIIVYRGLNLRCYWLMWTNVGTGYSKVYINGVAIGVEKSTSSTTPVVFTEDVSVVSGDLLQIYAHSNGSVTVVISTQIIQFIEYVSNDP